MTRKTLWAVVDQGSTSTKGALITDSGSTVYQTSRRVARDVTGDRVSHDPERLARSVEKILDRLIERGPKRSIGAIGLTCQRSTCLVWDRDSGEPLTEARSWQDRTQAPRARQLAEHDRSIRRRTGLPLSPHYAALKLSHLLSRLPGGRRRAEAGELVAGTLDAFLVRRLVGRDLTEPGHAGRTLCFHLAKGAWDAHLCKLFRVPEVALPEIVPSAELRGTHQGIPLTAVAGDQQAALLGHGGWKPGVTAAHFGTGAFVLAATGAQPRQSSKVLSAVIATTARSRRFQVEGSVNSAGSAVDWVFAITKSRLRDWQDREIEAGNLPAVLPAFAGLATPWWRPETRAVYSGINPATTANDLIAGTLYALAMRILDCVESLKRAGVSTRVLRVSGKLTRLRGLVQLLADAGQLRVDVSADEETGLAGIARLAAAGASGMSGVSGARGSARALRFRPRTSASFRPRWSKAEARTARRRWQRFVRRAMPVAAESRF